MAYEGVEKIYREISELSGSEKKILLTKLVTEIISHDSAAREIDIYDLKGVGKEVWNNIDAQEYVNSERASW